MKGISAVIAVVLILMITVALSGAAYVWFSGVFDTITEGAGDAADNTADVISTSFAIATASKISSTTAEIYIVNTGSSNIDMNKVIVFADDKLADIESSTPTSIASGAAGTIKINNSGSYTENFCGTKIQVSYGSLKQTTSLPTCEDPCGNNVIDDGEDCDGTATFTDTCDDIITGTTGTLTCDANCEFITTDCV